MASNESVKGLLKWLHKKCKGTLYQQLKEISRWNIPLISCAIQVQEQEQIIWDMCGPVGTGLEEFYCTYLFPCHFCWEVIYLLNLYQPCAAVLRTYLHVIQLAAS